MRQRWCWPVLLAMIVLAGCQLTREPKPPRPAEEFRVPPDEARYQTPNFYPNSVLNQDNHAKTHDDDKKGGLLNKGIGRGMGGMGGPGR